MPETNNVAIRKRQQIENAGKAMFLWVAAAAAVLGIAVVLSISLFERIAYNQKVIGAMTDTANTLRENNAVVDQLKDNVRVMNTNQALADTPRLEGTEPLSVILDALPSNPNSSALGASLQQKLLNGDGVKIENLIVNPIAGAEDSGTDAEATESTSTTEAGENEITFSFTISTPTSGGADRLRDALRKLERSIRVVNLTSVSVEQQNNTITLSAEGKAYYQPEVKVELKEKEIPKS